MAGLCVSEPRCGPMTGAGGGASADAVVHLARNDGVRLAPASGRQESLGNTHEVAQLIIPNENNPLEAVLVLTTDGRQVNFNYGNDGNIGETARTLSGLEKDCFIIPVHSLDRFLPAGVPMPKPPPVGNSLEKKSGNLHVMEVPDPKLCVLCHLMSPLEPIDPVLESPLVQPLFKQRVTAGGVGKRSGAGQNGCYGYAAIEYGKKRKSILRIVFYEPEFPFITYYVINTSQTNPVIFYNNLRTASLTKFDPRVTRYTAAHTLDLYTEVAAICRPPIHEIGMSLTKTHTASTGYLVSVYKVFEGDDREKFERNWLYWTGARMIYRYLPSAAGLRRISLHKSLSPKGDKMYILLCECANLLNDVTVCALILPALRARLTGYTGIFRPLQTF
ncbi:hypothetical protein NQ315_010584 [Exocentrus adspersus]|uniref:DUF7153 domain-containing protein n=1 Tax=Exocentrus adspersus TaxID=1586481 RepID=A0AAV8W5R7_9CUCU|nr:hypothetical protein NQ315_010584 [Exocentrus adspersus]